MYQYAFPNKTPEYIVEHRETYQKLGQLRWEDGKDHLIPQDYADRPGWKELARKVDSFYSTLPNKEQVLVLCDNYGQAGAINYYTKQTIKVVSFNADYVNWFNMHHKYIHLIRVKDFKNKDPELTMTGPYFQRSFLADSITNKYARGYRTKFFVFINAKIDINQRIDMEIEEVGK